MFFALTAIVLAANAPAAGATKAKVPETGDLETRAVAGGWFLEPAQHSDRTQLGLPSLDTNGTRFLTALVQYDEAQVRIVKSSAVVATADGRVEKVIDLRRLLPVDWRLSGDGKSAAVLAQDSENPQSDRATLLVFDLAKSAAEPARLAVELDTRLVAGKSVFALEAMPAWLPTDELEGIDEADTGGGNATKSGAVGAGDVRAAEPVMFVRGNGDRIAAKTPIAGEVTSIRNDGGFAVLGKGKLVRVDASLAKMWEAKVGFDGPVVASDDGSLIVVADATPGKAARTLMTFDKAGVKKGEVSFPAPLMVDLAVAPDGSGFLVAAAPLVSPTMAKYDGLPEVLLACYSPDGKLKWSRPAKRDTPSRSYAHLSLSKGSTTAAVGWIADVADSMPEVLVLGKDGKPLYKTEGPFDALALDPSGAALWTLEGSMLSRLSVKSLAAGNATNPK